MTPSHGEDQLPVCRGTESGEGDRWRQDGDPHSSSDGGFALPAHFPNPAPAVRGFVVGLLSLLLFFLFVPASRTHSSYMAGLLQAGRQAGRATPTCTAMNSRRVAGIKQRASLFRHLVARKEQTNLHHRLCWWRGVRGSHCFPAVSRYKFRKRCSGRALLSVVCTHEQKQRPAYQLNSAPPPFA